jgi:hypothetical protein
MGLEPSQLAQAVAKLVNWGKGVRRQLCEAPEGPFRQLTPDPFAAL